ncbi:C-3 sterol dehydrogenase/C-4 decarboxylase family protein [Akanthomyces lecanii RCEF 1005]|uniref:C-3 sterol dehydrogenase/C-4 decarboxylase family protein n=1 Tax=Akanthomyces lecanii RCEF 1005 TaxID=1081108 RepID=A0A167NUZ8_CORDF|nr:C-3 sterol dehydrogenase/C-4 decarboxylase family protein [Akanthomyces lecanii RCEF 1005]
MSVRSAGQSDLGKLLVVGGNGFLGHHLLRRPALRPQPPSDAGYHECDITDSTKLAAIFDKIRPDVVIYTASPIASDNAVQTELFRRVNVDGTRSVIDACQKAHVKALVPIQRRRALPVIRAPQQTEYYSEKKAAAEELVMEANRAKPTPSFPTTFLQVCSTPYRTGKSKVQLDNNNKIYDFAYVGNVAHAHLLAARLWLLDNTTPTTPPDYDCIDGEVFFVTNDEPVYFWDYARAVWHEVGNDASNEDVWRIPRDISLFLGMEEAHFTKQRASFSIMTRYYNICKAKTMLGYEPRWTLQQGVVRGVKWFLDREEVKAP